MRTTTGKSVVQSRRRLRALVLAGLCGLGAAWAGALYLESFVAAPPCCYAAWPVPNPVQTERRLDLADPSGASAVLQERAARQVLSARPVDPSGWLRLAYADALRNRRLTRQGLYAFSTSYTMAAYAGRNAAWRVAFGLDHWYELDADTRRQVQVELEALSRDHVRREAALRLIGGVSNPVGRYLAFQHDLLPPPAPKTSR